MSTTPYYSRPLALLVWAALVAGTAPEKADAEAVAGGSSASVPDLAWRPCPDPA